MLTAAYDSSIRQVGTQRWLQELIGQRQRRQHFGTLETIGELLAVWAWAAAERMLRQRNLDFLAPPCKRCWRRLAAQL